MHSSPSTTLVSKPGTGLPNEPRRCSGWSDSSSLIVMTLPASVMPSMVCRNSGSAGRTSGAMIGYRFPRRIEDRSRRGRLGWRARWAIPATKPLVMVGFSASSRSSVSPASVALEHTSVEPASRVASTANAIPPIQKNGELQNSLSFAVRPRISLRTSGVPAATCACAPRPWGRSWTPTCTRSPADPTRRRRLPSPRAASRPPLIGFVVDQDVAQQRGSSLHLGKPLSVVVRAEGGSGQQDFGIAVDELYRQLGAVAKVENGMTTAPMRAAANIATIHAARSGRARRRGSPFRRRGRSDREPVAPTGGRPLRS